MLSPSTAKVLETISHHAVRLPLYLISPVLGFKNDRFFGTEIRVLFFRMTFKKSSELPGALHLSFGVFKKYNVGFLLIPYTQDALQVVLHGRRSYSSGQPRFAYKQHSQLTRVASKISRSWDEIKLWIKRHI